jgi:toxin CcdB
MAQQFDIFRMSGGEYVVITQSDLLEAMRTRVVAPLLPSGSTGQPIRHLNPEIAIGSNVFVLMPQLLATLSVHELGERLGTAAYKRDEIIRALDALLSGV